MLKQLTVLKDMKYGTRMLKAGETVEMDGPTTRLYTALGAVGPRTAKHKTAVPAMTTQNMGGTKPARKRKAPAKKK